MCSYYIQRCSPLHAVNYGLYITDKAPDQPQTQDSVEGEVVDERLRIADAGLFVSGEGIRAGLDVQVRIYEGEDAMRYRQHLSGGGPRLQLVAIVALEDALRSVADHPMWNCDEHAPRRFEARRYTYALLARIAGGSPVGGVQAHLITAQCPSHALLRKGD